MWGRGLATLAVVVLLAGCARIVPEAQPPVPPANAVVAGVRPGPDIASLPFAADDARAALAGFAESCPKLLARQDQSWLTSPADWQGACAAAATWPASNAAAFFTSHFETAEVAGGQTFATGYYEPEIAGARTHLPGYDVPVYGLPPDLVCGWPANTPPEQRTGRAPLGRYDASGNFVPYYTRAEIEDGALAGKGLEIAWAKDPVEFFFLQIQGSGRLVAPDGSVMRIGYAGQNGRDYTAIGATMRQQGLIGDAPGQYPGSMQGIMQYLRANPAAGNQLMRTDDSYVFFREIVGDGPIGALGVPVRRESSVAADPAFVPLGAPVFLQVDRPEASGLWIAQDTGGAIKGANRFDTFWGAGADARTIAGGMSARGTALVLLPKGTLKRLGAR
ncbi:MAG TPA: murein transglycosylase A [Sphingomonadaceae bacterium]